MDSSKPEPRSTNFDSDAEDGELSSSPKTKQIPLEAVPSDIMKGTEVDYGDFVMDRTESLSMDGQGDSSADSSQLSACSAWMVSNTAGLLVDADLVEKVDAPEPPAKRHRNACFNCDGPHNLNECKEPRDQRRIREKQAEMKERRRTMDVSRYHDESGHKEGESEYTPGRISSELREALGIGSDDIPEWIYRMRRMGFLKGYPPAYLRQAIVSKDRPGEVLKFHLIDKSMNGEFNAEEEEEEEETPPPVVDSNKIFFYLGFNKTYRHLRDRERNFRIPPFDEFVRFHQDDLVKNWHADKSSRLKEKERRKRRAKEMQDEGDIIVLDSSSADDDDCIVIDREPTKSSEEAPERCSTPQEPSSSTDFKTPKTPKGTLLETISGTPVMIRKNADGKDIHNTLPSLDAFSKGITPFSVKEEPTPHRGFLRAIVAKIKKVTSKK